MSASNRSAWVAAHECESGSRRRDLSARRILHAGPLSPAAVAKPARRADQDRALACADDHGPAGVHLGGALSAARADLHPGAALGTDRRRRQSTHLHLFLPRALDHARVLQRHPVVRFTLRKERGRTPARDARATARRRHAQMARGHAPVELVIHAARRPAHVRHRAGRAGAVVFLSAVRRPLHRLRRAARDARHVGSVDRGHVGAAQTGPDRNLGRRRHSTDRNHLVRQHLPNHRARVRRVAASGVGASQHRQTATRPQHLDRQRRDRRHRAEGR